MVDMSEIAEGQPLAYLTEDALPTVVKIMRKGQMALFRVQGSLVEIDGKLLLEINRIELDRGR